MVAQSIKILLWVLIGITAWPPHLQAGVIVNEVLANEPGGSVTLEWIELYNDSSDTVSLDGYRLQIKTKSFSLDSTNVMIPGGFLIICRKLFTDNISPGFEEYWGDNSATWGNTNYESLIPEPLVASFSLTNSGGQVELYNSSDALVSELSWVESGKDGYSWEYVSPTSNETNQSIDNFGSTPGRINSLTPVPYDLGMNIADVQSVHGEALLTLNIINSGENVIDNALLSLTEIGFEADNLIPETLKVINVPLMTVGDTILVKCTLSLAGVYSVVEAMLPDDDRISNNCCNIIVPGIEFPPLILTELLANPSDGFHCEWVEIFNRCDSNINLIDFQFGDSIKLQQISAESYDIISGEYLVLAQNTLEFLNYYPEYNGRVIKPPAWSSFNNNTPDVVRLVDQFGIELDRLSYNQTFPSNHTWSRNEPTSNEQQWGSSENPRGTPGQPNETFFGPNSGMANLNISPKVFSPDGDGLNESVTISVEAPQDKEYKLKIYDRQGRTVYTFDRVRDENIWRGQGNSGNRLPIGIYIIYLEIVGGESIKETVVIAR